MLFFCLFNNVVNSLTLLYLCTMYVDHAQPTSPLSTFPKDTHPSSLPIALSFLLLLIRPRVRLLLPIGEDCVAITGNMNHSLLAVTSKESDFCHHQHQWLLR